MLGGLLFVYVFIGGCKFQMKREVNVEYKGEGPYAEHLGVSLYQQGARTDVSTYWIHHTHKERDNQPLFNGTFKIKLCLPFIEKNSLQGSC